MCGIVGGSHLCTPVKLARANACVVLLVPRLGCRPSTPRGESQAGHKCHSVYCSKATEILSTSDAGTRVAPANDSVFLVSCVAPARGRAPPFVVGFCPFLNLFIKRVFWGHHHHHHHHHRRRRRHHHHRNRRAFLSDVKAIKHGRAACTISAVGRCSLAWQFCLRSLVRGRSESMIGTITDTTLQKCEHPANLFAPRERCKK